MEISGARVVITRDTLAGTMLKLEESCPTIERVVTVGDGGPVPVNGCLRFEDMISVESDGARVEKSNYVSGLLLFSSGTTGPPKGVMLSHSALSTNLLQYSAGIRERLRQPSTDGRWQERLLAVLPFFHIYGMTSLLNYGMFGGCHTMVLPKFNPPTFTAALRQHRPTFLPLVPSLISFLVNDSQVFPEDFKDLHTILTAGSPFGQSLRDQFKAKYGDSIAIMENYGLTEMPFTHIFAVSLQKSGDHAGSVGQPLVSTLTKIIDMRDGKALPSFQTGEICMKGPQVSGTKTKIWPPNTFTI